MADGRPQTSSYSQLAKTKREREESEFGQDIGVGPQPALHPSAAESKSIATSSGYVDDVDENGANDSTGKQLNPGAETLPSVGRRGTLSLRSLIVRQQHEQLKPENADDIDTPREVFSSTNAKLLAAPTSAAVVAGSSAPSRTAAPQSDGKRRVLALRITKQNLQSTTSDVTRSLDAATHPPEEREEDATRDSGIDATSSDANYNSAPKCRPTKISLVSAVRRQSSSHESLIEPPGLTNEQIGYESNAPMKLNGKKDVLESEREKTKSGVLISPEIQADRVCERKEDNLREGCAEGSQKGKRPLEVPLPGLEAYDFGACYYSGHLNNLESDVGDLTVNTHAVFAPTATIPASSTAQHTTATPIGFITAARSSRVAFPGIDGCSFTKHSKVGFPIPPPTNDMGLAPFFHPSAFSDLNQSITNALLSNLMMTSPSPSQAGVSGGIRSGGYVSAQSSLGVLSCQSPVAAGHWGGVSKSMNSSPAYGAPTYPRTPTTAGRGGFTSPGNNSNNYTHYNTAAVASAISMSSPVPFGVTSSSNIPSNGDAGNAPHLQDSANRSPSLSSPPGPALYNAPSGCASATAFIPLPRLLQVPMFVVENKTTKMSDETQRCESLFPVVTEDLFATALHPFASSYDFDPRDKMGEGTYGAVYIGYTKPTPARPNRSKVAIKLMKQLPNFEGFPITSVREISVHRYLRSQPEANRSKLLVVDDVRFEYLDQAATAQGSLTSEMQRELIAVNQRLPPSLQNLPASRKGMVIGEIVVLLVSPFVEHTLTSIRQSLRMHGAGGSSLPNATAGASQLANAFQQGFDHRSLAASSHQQQPLSPLAYNEGFILFIFIQILEGLHQLHRARIMHRDIKEDNILVTRNGDVLICDFGLAVPLEGERAKITPSLIVMFYRPPEMLLGASQYSTAVDMWSAGCLLAQQFLGIPPFITKDGQPTNEFDQLRIIADVLGPLPAKLIELASHDVRSLIFNHPQRDLIFERETWVRAPTGGGVGKTSDVPPPLTTTERFNRFRTWFDQTYKMRRRAHINNVALEMPTLDTLIAIFNMLSLDPSSRPSAERMLKCNERSCSNRFASNASIVGAANANASELSMRSLQTAHTLQQSLCWSCRAKSKMVFMKEGVSKLPPPKTHLRPKQQPLAQ